MQRGQDVFLDAYERRDYESMEASIRDDPTLMLYFSERLLMRAVREGDKTMVEFLVRHGADVQSQDNTALLTAVARNDVSLTRLLLDEEADIHARDDEAFVETVYNAVLYVGDGFEHYKNMIDLLIERGADVRARHNRPLFDVIRLTPERHDVVRFLLAHGADIHFEYDWPLRFAADKNDLLLVELLLELGADVRSAADHVLVPAVTFENIPMLQLVLEYGDNVQHRKNMALGIATEHDKRLVVNYLLDHGANVDAIAYDRSLDSHHFLRHPPLKIAVKNNNIRMARLLLDRGANVNAYNGTALIEAIFSRNNDMIDLLLDRGADVNVDNGEALRLVAYENNERLVQRFLDRGATTQTTTRALQNATQNNRIVYMLLDHGADIHANTALYFAIHHDNFSFVQYMLDPSVREVGADRRPVPVGMLRVSQRDSERMLRLLSVYGVDLVAIDPVAEERVRRARLFAEWVHLARAHKHVCELVDESDCELRPDPRVVLWGITRREIEVDLGPDATPFVWLDELDYRGLV